MLVLDIESADPKNRALIAFFSRAHSVDAAIEGWQLALWCPNGRPAALSSRVARKQSKSDASKGGMAAFGWPRQGRAKNWAVVPIDDVRAAPELIEPGQQVVLALRELPKDIRGVLRLTLKYEPDLEKQILGWWYDRDDELPDKEPPWRPTASLLPEHGGDLQEGKCCLVLIEVNDCWLVLSERALRTYAFGDRLAEGEPVLFVRVTGNGLETWKASPAQGLAITDVHARFGPEAAERARDDAASVTVVVNRYSRA